MFAHVPTQTELEYLGQQASRLEAVIERYELATAEMAVMMTQQEAVLRQAVAGAGGTQQLMARLLSMERCVLCACNHAGPYKCMYECTGLALPLGL